MIEASRGGALLMGSHMPVTLAGTALEECRHVCAFFHSSDQQYRVLLPFIREGIQRGERAFHIVDPALRADHLERLRNDGIGVEEAERSGRLEVRVWDEVYLCGGRFNQDAMLALIQDVLTRGKSEGASLTRLVANMEWALENRPGVHEIVEYESRLNLVLPRYNDPVICTYDLARFGGEIILDILRTHPLVIIGGILHENPFFVPPDEFLRELRARRLQAS
jgi:hypothetical protein